MQGTRPPTRTQRRPLAILLGSLLSSVLFPAPVRAASIELVADNDFLTSNEPDDDQYSFAVELKVETRSYTFVFRENAFTDKEAGQRFDETSLSVGRRHTSRRRPGWSFGWQLGVMHVGRGLFGQSAQNAVHRLIGNRELELRYPESAELYLSLAVDASRQFRLTPWTSVGPHLALASEVGFKSQVYLGLGFLWQVGDEADLRFSVGLKATDSSHAALRDHLRGYAAAAELSVDLPGGLVATWTYNRYGTGRQHLSFGYRFATGRLGRE